MPACDCIATLFTPTIAESCDADRADHRMDCMQNGLAARGVEVVRLNTYTTRQVSAISENALQLARQARVLAIASPSAVRCVPLPAWLPWSFQLSKVLPMCQRIDAGTFWVMSAARMAPTAKATVFGLHEAQLGSCNALKSGQRPSTLHPWAG